MYTAIACVACYVLGLLTQRFVLSETKTVKAHVTAEVEKLRQDFSLWLGGLGKKIG